MRDKAILLLVAVGLIFAAWGDCQAGEHPGAEAGDRRDTAASPDWSLWLPSESWPSGEQYDPRLEQTVEFWGAGMPLRDVFASVKEQTGVEIGFWPPGDENERICVNLYLNPDDPPTLRELMAQLSWVTDCGFGFTREQGDPKYWLLSTSSRYGAERRLRAETRALLDGIRERQHGREEQTSAKVAAKLAELTEALALPREEAIRRYRGADDLLLLALLEPGRRRVSEFVLGLSDEHLVRLLDEGELRFEWEDLSPEEKDTLREHFRSSASHAMEEGYVRADPSFGWNPSGEIPFMVVLTGARHGFFVIRGEFWSDEDQDEAGLVFAGQHLRLVSGVQRAEETMALLRALGEEPDSTVVDAMYDEADTAARALRRQRLEQQLREWMRSQLGRRSIASSEVRNILTTFRFPGSRDGSYPLWAVQEAVAAGTGLHIVSDCFSQPSRSIVVFLELLDADEVPDMTGLLALKLWTLSAAEEGRLPRTGINDAEVGWEWGDAGSFLRFRHLARDLWRAAFLSETVVREVDGWLGLYVTRAVESEESEIAVEVTLDLREASRIVCQLTDWQLYHGAKINYGDPFDETEAYRQEMREAVLVGAISRSAGIFRLFGTFSEDQWERVWVPGLRWGEDLTPSQQAMRVSNYFAPFRDQMPGIVMRLHEGPLTHGLGGVEMPDVKDMYVLQFSRDREQADEDLAPGLSGAPPPPHFTPELPVPRTIVVHLRRPEGLLALTTPGQQAEQGYHEEPESEKGVLRER